MDRPRFRMGSLLLALGLVAGAGTSLLLRPSPTTAADRAGAGAMRMAPPARTAGYGEMSRAMDRMMARAAANPETGTQDEDFMLMMVPHHQAAVEMAKTELRLGTHPELKALARAIVADQDREIAQMRGWLKAWYARGS